MYDSVSKAGGMKQILKQTVRDNNYKKDVTHSPNQFIRS
jgi:hypothetical protein